MQNTMINHTTEYLLRQRLRNDKDISRTLKKYTRYFLTRDQIPLDRSIYADENIDDLRIILNISERILSRLERKNIDNLSYRQLELFQPLIEETFMKDQYTSVWNKAIPDEWVIETREEFMDEKLNDIWKHFLEIHNDVKKNPASNDNFISIKMEVNNILNFLLEIIKMNDFNMRRKILEMIETFMKEMLDFLMIHYPDEKEVLCARFIDAHHRLSNQLKNWDKTHEE